MSIEALNWALDHMARTDDMSTSTKVVLMLLANRADPETGACYPSVRYIMARSSLGESTVRAVCRELVRRNLLAIEPRAKPDGRQTSNTYRMRLETPPPPAVGGYPPDIGGGPSSQWRGIPQPLEGPPPANGPHDTKEGDVLSLTGEAPHAPKNGSRHHKPPDTSPVVIELPMRGTTTFPIRQRTIAELEPLYPAVDVPQTLREMKGWLIGHPERRPRRRMMGFVTTWLKKEQDEHGGQA